MKIRSSFVSNSSSSSFILGFDKSPKKMTIEKLREVLFDERTHIGDLWEPLETFETLKIAEFLKDQFVNVPDKEVWKLIDSGQVNGSPDYWDNTEKHPDYIKAKQNVMTKFGINNIYAIKEENKQDKDYKNLQVLSDKLYKEYQKKCEEWTKKYWEKEKIKFEGKKIYTIELEDKGLYSSLESGYAFERLPHIRVSKH